MNYLLLIPSLEIGGAEKQAIGFAKFLLDNGRNVTILSDAPEGEVLDICHNNNIPCYSFNNTLIDSNSWIGVLEKKHLWPRGLRLVIDSSVLALVKFICRNSIDICISYCSNSGTLLGRAARLNNKPKYIWYQRDAGIYTASYVYEKYAIGGFDGFLANGIQGKEYIEHKYNKKTEIIYNGVERFTPITSVDEWKRRLGVKKEDLLCTMVANLHEAKDHMSILEIWNNLLKYENPIPHLVFAGRFDNEYTNLKEYVIKHNLTNYVHFLGQIDDVAGLLAATDICVFGAKSEGNPNGIIEAAMIGLSVFATDLPEIRDVISVENYPYLFNRGDMDHAVKAIRILIHDEPLRKEIGRSNQKKSLDKFNAMQNFKKLMDYSEQRV